MRIKVVLENVNAGENGVKMRLLESIFIHIQRLNFGKGVYELEDHVGQEALSLNLLLFNLGL
jgi:hypothetical protein